MAEQKEPRERFEEVLAETRNMQDTRKAFEALADMANLYSTCDSHGEAIRCHEEILRLDEAKRFLSIEEHQEILASLGTSCLMKGDLKRASLCCEELLQTGRIKDAKIRARVYVLASWTELSLGNLERAQSFKDEVGRVLEEREDCGLRTRYLLLSGSVALREGRLYEAQELYEEALWMARKHCFKDLLADAHNNLGLIFKNKCSWGRAIEHLETALSLDREEGNYFKVAARGTNLGIVLLKSGRWLDAEKMLEESLEANRRIDRAPGIVRTLIALGNAKRHLGFHREAEALYLEAISLSGSLGLKREECLAREFMGELLFEMGFPEKALATLSQALEEAEKMAPDGDIVAEVERRRAQVFYTLHRDVEAEISAKRALECARRIGDRFEEGASLRVLGEISRKGERVDEARKFFELSIQTLRKVEEKFELAKTCFSLGKLLLEVSDSKDGKRLLFTSLALFEELGAQTLSEKVQEEILLLKEVEISTSHRMRKSEPSFSGRPFIKWGIVTGGDSLNDVFAFVEKVSSVPFPVLIEGETGTGKELIARAIHFHGRRSRGRLLARNCTTLPETLFESELFGHAKGAFTGASSEKRGIFEEADGGTLLLDEIGDLPEGIQVKLLRVLEDGEIVRIGETKPRKVDVRIIAATSKNLEEEVREGRFRAELFYRLSTLRVKLPPLRERKKDIPHLLNYFLDKYARMLEVEPVILSGKTLDLLLGHDWPGNVRELENAVKRIVTLFPSGQDIISPCVLEKTGETSPRGNGCEPGMSLKSLVRKVEIGEIGKTLALANGNKSLTARILGIDRKTLRKRLTAEEEVEHLADTGEGPASHSLRVA